MSQPTAPERAFTEVKISVPWGHVTGKWYGSRLKQPVIAIHGWQDNAGTFDRLIPLLPAHIPVFSIDLPGHGFSSHYPQGVSYNLLYDGPLLLRRLVKDFNWQQPITILGHSLGGVIGFFYAATYPDEVEKLIQIDIACFPIRSTYTFLDTFKSSTDRFLKFENLSESNVPRYDKTEMVDIVLEAHKGSLTRESCEIMLKRGLIPSSSDGKFIFSRDVRLKVAVVGLGTFEQSLEVASQIRCKVLNIRGNPGATFLDNEQYTKVLDKIGERASVEFHKIDGTHHLHLNNPERIYEIISKFLTST